MLKEIPIAVSLLRKTIRNRESNRIVITNVENTNKLKSQLNIDYDVFVDFFYSLMAFLPEPIYSEYNSKHLAV